MNKDKNIYEFVQATYNKLFIKLRDNMCEITYVNYSHERDEEWTPEGHEPDTITIPIALLSRLREGIDKALKELKYDEDDTS